MVINRTALFERPSIGDALQSRREPMSKRPRDPADDRRSRVDRRHGFTSSRPLLLAQLGDLELVGFGALLHRLLAAGQRLRDGANGHPLAGEQMQLLGSRPAATAGGAVRTWSRPSLILSVASAQTYPPLYCVVHLLFSRRESAMTYCHQVTQGAAHGYPSPP